MKKLFVVCLLLFIVYRTYGQQKPSVSEIQKKIDSLVNTLYDRGQFNGSILVSIHQKPVFVKGIGKSNLQKDINFTPVTPSYLASVSKPFTAMAIMILVKDGLINFDDAISKYFPDFPNGGKITIRNLLNHTSGIINYENIGIDNPGLTNHDVYTALVKQQSLRFTPGAKYEYSNSGYILLAMIVERVSGMSFSEFMTKNIFSPLKMANSFVYDGSENKKLLIAKAYAKFGEESDALSLTTGDGGICSTVYDLFKWDKALYTNTLVSQSILKQAFAPARLNDGTTSPYGFGWMLRADGNKQIVYHTGGSGGFRTYFERQLAGHNSIIILNNMENSPRREISEAIDHILKGEDYQLPKISIATIMYKIRNADGIDSAIRLYNVNKLQHPAEYEFAEQELNSLGYKLWSINKIDEAIQIFRLNASAFPSSSNSWESLGEAYLNRKDKVQAEDCFKKSLTLDPGNQDALRMMKQIH